MAKINSGLGWECDEQYYIYDEDTYLSTQTYAFYKNSDGAAIAAYICSSDGWYTPFLISTVAANVGFKPSNTESAGHTTINGVTWYYSESNYISRFKDTTATIPFVDLTNEGITISNKVGITTKLLTASNMSIIRPPAASLNYVKTFVEGVESETAIRVKSLYNMIAPTFDSSVSYTVNDIVIYNNKLYKCTTSHLGTWDSSDFTETTIVQLFG